MDVKTINTKHGAHNTLSFQLLCDANELFYELDPIHQLNKRVKFQQKYKELALNNPFDATSSDDLFAIYDAVSRRGYFHMRLKINH